MTRIKEEVFCPKNKRHLEIVAKFTKGSNPFKDRPDECPMCGEGTTVTREVIECEHEELMLIREEEKVECLVCSERWVFEEAKELGFFDKMRF